MENKKEELDPVKLISALIALAAGLYGLSLIF